MKYELSPYGNPLPACPHIEDTRRGSLKCTNKCEYVSDFEQDTDPHGRIDTIYLTCNHPNETNEETANDNRRS